MIGDTHFNVVCESRVVGEFHGYKQGRYYRLENGETWWQDGIKTEFLYRENPRCRILTDGMGGMFIDVEGTSSIARVLPVEKGRIIYGR